IYRALQTAGLVQKPVHGQSYDPNWLNFFAWIANQATLVNPQQSQGTVPTPTLPSIPGFTTGGVVPQTMPAMVHAGEYIIPSDIFQKFITSLNNFSSRIDSSVNNNPVTNLVKTLNSNTSTV